MAELLDRHLTLVHASGTTRRSYRWTVSKHIQPLLGHLRLAAITPELLDHFYAELPIQGGSVHPYLRRRNGQPWQHEHPLLAGALDRTLGVPLFQKQVMQMFSRFRMSHETFDARQHA